MDFTVILGLCSQRMLETAKNWVGWPLRCTNMIHRGISKNPCTHGYAMVQVSVWGIPRCSEDSAALNILQLIPIMRDGAKMVNHCPIWVCLKRGAPKFWWFKHHFSYRNSHLAVYAHFQSFLFQRSQHSLFPWGLQMKINAQRKRYVHLGLSEITAAGHLKNRCGPSFSYEYNQFGRYSNKINS